MASILKNLYATDEIKNHIGVDENTNIFKKLGYKDIVFFIQSDDYTKTFYITNKERKQRVYYSSDDNLYDIVYVPDLENKDLFNLDVVDKIYVHAFLLRFFSKLKNFNCYNWEASIDFIMNWIYDDLNNTLSELQKRYPDFYPDFSKKNLDQWAKIIAKGEYNDFYNYCPDF
ncbi:hypothetical protein [Mycoplasma procyoni]|uniref:hypothetical protein n=1 Tax=Mycoplasma procyoni TaxID=568784 RepID=UPI00197BE241|nr:hypothetical protein [Mycoplasma procyoni]MBN3535139.1 hypothetical protein [Mycoplasma procyoni]